MDTGLCPPLFYFTRFCYATDIMPHVIALDLGGTSLKGALVDRDGAIGARDQQSTSGQDKEGIVATIVAMVKKLQNNTDAVEGVGLGMPGPLDPFSGVVHTTPNLPFKEPFPMKEVLEKETGLRVLVNNDANLAALGEWWKGAAAGVKNVVMLTLGTGIGGGLIIEGKLFIGSGGFGAELGHITIANDGPPCGCGAAYGCFEALASGTAIIRAAQEEINPKITNAKEVEDLAQQGNEAARAIWEDEGKWLGIAIANYLNIFNPDAVIVGGAIAAAWPLFERRMREEIRARAFDMMVGHATIMPAQLGNDAGITGAARMVLDAK